MTNDEITNVFKSNTFLDAKNILREECERLGVPLTGNEQVAELRQLILSNSQTCTAVNDTSANDVDDELSSMPTSGGAEPATSEPEPSSIEPPKSARRNSKKSSASASASGTSGKGKTSMEMRDEAQRLLEEAAKKDAEEERLRLEEEARKREENRLKALKGGGSGVNFRHEKTDELIETLSTIGIAYLVGPSGTGKSTLAMTACSEMFNLDIKDVKNGEKFAQISFSPDTLSMDMIGFTDVNGVYHETDIVKVFRDGGVLLFDEIDNADASILVKLNTAIANGVLPTPNGNVLKSEQTYIICTANTFGTGADSQYVGRTRLDAATLDRFTMAQIEVDYDNKLEMEIINSIISDNDVVVKLCSFIDTIRNVVNSNHLKRVVSTRFVINASRFLANGKNLNWVVNKFLLGWSAHEKDLAIAAISN